MEDDSGLELSLGLSCGGSSVKPKSKNGSSSDTRSEEVGRGGKMVEDFKSMFDTDPQKTDSLTGSRRSASSKPEENFFSDLSKVKEDNASLNLNGRGFLVANSSNKPIAIEDDKRLEVGNKRKMSFDDICNQKKHDSDVHHADLHDRARASRVSVTEDGSTAENEDVADSEAENSTSKSLSRHSDGSKGFIRVGASSDAPKDIRLGADSSAIDFNGQKRFTATTERDFKHANMTYGASFSVQPVNMMNVPYTSVKESNSVGAPNHQIPGVMHVMPTSTGERQGGQSVSNGSLPMMFGYPPVQLPMLDKDNSWGMVSSRPQQLHPSFAGRGPPNSVALHMNNISETMPYEGRPLERTKGDGKQRVTEEGSSSQPEDVKGSSTNLRAKDVSEQSKGEGTTSTIDFSNIKPGLAADVKFGGCGSYPNLPWVSTTGSNGRTISGVTYRYNNNQIRIVCACHGSHMTPEEFARHANDDQANQEGNAVLGTVANGNPAASSHG